jgi:3-methyladenine DNA glycosylase AlkD
VTRPTRTATCDELLVQIKALANPANVAGMARFGINPANTLGVSMVALRALAKGLRDHSLALQLWDSGIHEARILASLVDDPALVDEAQMERWAAGFDSWDVVDQVCSNLFDRTPLAVDKVHQWSSRPEEYVKRAAFTLMATLATHSKAPDPIFLDFLPLIRRESVDRRNFVKKAVNWALRGIGKRSRSLYTPALELSRELSQSADPTARWIGKDALRELETRDPARFKR